MDFDIEIDIGSILAARRSLEDQIHELDLGDGQVLRYKIPDAREIALKEAAIEARFRQEGGLGPDGRLPQKARTLCQVFALNETGLVGWSGIPDGEGGELPDKLEDGSYHYENGDRLLEIGPVGLLLLAAVAEKRIAAQKEAAEAKKASKPRSQRRRGTAGGRKSVPGRSKTNAVTGKGKAATRPSRKGRSKKSG